MRPRAVPNHLGRWAEPPTGRVSRYRAQRGVSVLIGRRGGGSRNLDADRDAKMDAVPADAAAYFFCEPGG
jgi:hypothetical protein